MTIDLNALREALIEAEETLDYWMNERSVWRNDDYEGYIEEALINRNIIANMLKAAEDAAALELGGG